MNNITPYVTIALISGVLAGCSNKMDQHLDKFEKIVVEYEQLAKQETIKLDQQMALVKTLLDYQNSQKPEGEPSESQRMRALALATRLANANTTISQKMLGQLQSQK